VVTIMPEKEWPTRTVGPFCRSSTRCAEATASGKVVRGFCTDAHLNPADCNRAIISKETKAWLAEQPAGRFKFTFTPKHGSWLNLVEGFFSKLTRSVLQLN
jgi:transposase